VAYYLILALIILVIPGVLVTAGRSANRSALVRTAVGSTVALLLVGTIDQIRTGSTSLAWTWVVFALALPVLVALVVRITTTSGFGRWAPWFFSYIAALLVVIVVSLVAARAAGPAPP